eukprot:gene14803-31446_t
MKFQALLFISSCFCSRSAVETYPQTINIGIIASRLTTTGIINTDGVHQIAAIVMAIKEINDKTDGVHDELLTHTQIKFALRTPSQNFLRGLEAAQDMANVVFGGDGVKAVIGAGGRRDVESYWSDLYPYYNRVNPVDAFGGKVIAKLIHDHFGWTDVNVLSTGDTYGTDVALEFKDACTELGINIENSYNFFPGMADFSSLIST